MVTRVLWYFCVRCDGHGICFLLGEDSEVSVVDASLWPGYFCSEYTVVAGQVRGGGSVDWESFRNSTLQMSSSGAHQGEESNQTQRGMFNNWNQSLLVWSRVLPHHCENGLLGGRLKGWLFMKPKTCWQLFIRYRRKWQSSQNFREVTSSLWLLQATRLLGHRIMAAWGWE